MNERLTSYFAGSAKATNASHLRGYRAAYRSARRGGLSRDAAKAVAREVAFGSPATHTGNSREGR